MNKLRIGDKMFTYSTAIMDINHPNITSNTIRLLWIIEVSVNSAVTGVDSNNNTHQWNGDNFFHTRKEVEKEVNDLYVYENQNVVNYLVPYETATDIVKMIKTGKKLEYSPYSDEE